MNSENVIGLDIGIASVGSAILDVEGNVLECTSNIFPEANAANNKTRRDMRQSRRLIRRRKTRINDFTKTWDKYGFDRTSESEIDVVSLKVKALYNAIELKDLYMVLRSELKHRGISYLEDDADAKGNSDYAKSLNANKIELKEKYPCEIQKERMEKYGFFRGNHMVLEGEEKVNLSNVFTTGAYRKEVEQILETQIKENTGVS
ncbi:MAG: type II CRISPR RNA-guided endonuclease Cas9, partial [Lachnospiraceae bacterium]|nr:type II CRISPR RNA-guided endonuclease Cas9 [Lachnospiraceae bacterium]